MAKEKNDDAQDDKVVKLPMENSDEYMTKQLAKWREQEVELLNQYSQVEKTLFMIKGSIQAAEHFLKRSAEIEVQLKEKTEDGDAEATETITKVEAGRA